MKEQLHAIIEAIVSNPAEVTIEEKQEGEMTIFEVKVAEADMGKVIGREGRIAKSIRTVMRAVAAKENKRISIEFIGWILIKLAIYVVKWIKKILNVSTYVSGFLNSFA